MAAWLGKMPTTSVRRLTFLLRRSMARSQHPILPRGAAQRDDVADLDVRCIHDFAVDEQPYQRAAQLDLGVVEPLCHEPPVESRRWVNRRSTRSALRVTREAAHWQHGSRDAA